MIEKTNLRKEVLNDLLKQLFDLYERKNQDYGDSVSKTYETYGLVSFLVRMEDKMNRLKTLYKANGDCAVLDETLDDTLMDLASYTLLALVERTLDKTEKGFDDYEAVAEEDLYD